MTSGMALVLLACWLNVMVSHGNEAAAILFLGLPGLVLLMVALLVRGDPALDQTNQTGKKQGA